MSADPQLRVSFINAVMSNTFPPELWYLTWGNFVVYGYAHPLPGPGDMNNTQRSTAPQLPSPSPYLCVDNNIRVKFYGRL